MGYTFGIVSTIFWAGNFIAAIDIHESIPPITLNFFRWVVATIVLIPFSIKIINKKNFVLLKKHFFFLSILSITGVSILNTFIYKASQTTSAINLSLIETSAPIFVVLISILFLKHKIIFREILGILITFFGVIYLITSGSFEKLLMLEFKSGDLYMLAAAFSFSIYSIFFKRKPKELSNHFIIFYTMILGNIFTIPFLIFEILHYKTAILFDTKTVLAILYVGIFASLAGYYLWNKALLYIGPVKTSIVYYLLPVFTSILGTIYLGEHFTITNLISMIIIIFGVILVSKQEKKPIIASEID
ncbi:DMT family transporter [Aureivirga marina]|uniref:DMT family transporter n=1 Tax=Aureivirga marina TaxID=1182451 RepID=UPI0018CB7884|nr:DMT family transporter [Aureivirga marina]